MLELRLVSSTPLGDRSALELVPERSRGGNRITEELIPELVSSTPLGDRSALELVPERSRGVVRIAEELIPEMVSSTPLGDRKNTPSWSPSGAEGEEEVKGKGSLGHEYRSPLPTSRSGDWEKL